VKEYVKEAKELAEKYAAKVIAAHKEIGLIAMPVKETKQHFRWLVRRIVLLESAETIAIADGVAKQSVQEGLKQASNLIAVKLPKLHAGRPRNRQVDML
jgi:hypothetical protein